MQDDDNDLDIINTTNNPLQTSHTAQVGLSSSKTSYDFAWSGDAGEFRLASHQHMEELEGDAGSGGYVYFETTVDSLLTFIANYDYQWPATVIGTSSVSLIVYDYTDEQRLFADGVAGGNVGLEPPFGSLEFNQAIPLPAAHAFVLHYSVWTSQYYPSPPGTFGTADAEIHFAITPVPEPATLVFLLPAMFLRSRQRSQK